MCQNETLEITVPTEGIIFLNPNCKISGNDFSFTPLRQSNINIINSPLSNSSWMIKIQPSESVAICGSGSVMVSGDDIDLQSNNLPKYLRLHMSILQLLNNFLH